MKRSQFFKTLFGGALGVAAAGKVAAKTKQVEISGSGELGNNSIIRFKDSKYQGLANGDFVDFDAPTIECPKDAEILIRSDIAKKITIASQNSSVKGITVPEEGLAISFKSDGGIYIRQGLVDLRSSNV